jgi:hypothetical protein
MFEIYTSIVLEHISIIDFYIKWLLLLQKWRTSEYNMPFVLTGQQC